MLGFLSTLLYIVIFILCLSVLIIVHELGHLTAAKVFKVYCFEFSIGMGPAIWKHKKKGGETQISFRSIPFGGYVAMYGEGMELPEGVQVDASRSLNGIKKWKQAIIIVAGVTMNAILALAVFFFKNAAFDQHQIITNAVTVTEGSICDNAGLPNNSILTYDENWADQGSAMMTKNGEITLNDDSVKETKVVLSPTSTFKDPVYIYTFYGIEDGKVKTTISYTPAEFKSIKIYLETKGENSQTYSFVLNVVDGVLEDSGMRPYVNTYRYSAGEVVTQSFADFGYSATAIIDSFRMMFVGEVGVDELSGIVGIGFEAKNILDTLDISTFVFLWGLISVNLAIVNLLPFPGLDGWQLLVIIVESITRKKFPEKVKNIVSFIGLALLIVLMVAILFKDIWVYILQGLFTGLVL